jgi:hypothetical protein
VSVRNANSQSVDGTTGKIADVPIAPSSVAGTDVGTSCAYNNGAVSVAFTPGSTYWPATSFTAVSNPGGLTGTGSSSPVIVSGLSSQTAYTFTVSGTNSAATSVASSASASVTATTVPQTPTIGTVTRVSDTAVSLPFTGSTGGKNLSAVTIASSPSLSLSYSGTTSPVTVSASYVYGTDYSFTMTSTNANGVSGTSSASNTTSPNLTQPNAYESIQTVTVGAGNQASISFTSIPSTYKHLQIRAINRSTRASAFGYWNMSFNSDTTNANYFWGHNLAGSGASAYADTFGSAPGIVVQMPGASQSANMFGATVIDIPDYGNTNKNKTTRTLNGHDFNGSGYMILSSGLWMSTAAITSITFTDQNANFAQYSSFALYGIKG